MQECEICGYGTQDVERGVRTPGGYVIARICRGCHEHLTDEQIVVYLESEAA